jgi:ferric-dicitrate binding protein FerR (iron transport regulator)
MHSRGTIDRYLAGDLGDEAAALLRAHLKECARCREYFDDQVRLLRALAGDASRPTPAEGVRMVRRAVTGAGLSLPPQPRAAQPAPRRSPLRLRPLLAAAATAVVLIGAVALWRGLRPTGGPAPAPIAAAPTGAPAPVPATLPASAPAPEVLLAGRLTQARRATLDGQPAAVGAEVRGGAVLHVAAGGHAEVALERGGRLRLYPQAQARVAGRDEVDLAGGRVWCQIDPGHGGFRVHTDEADARVVGTSFVVERQADRTDVRVMSGAVDVQDAGKRGVVRVKARERTRVEKRTAPSRVKRYAPEGDSGDWDHLVADIRRALKRTGKAIEKGLKSLGDKLK